MTWDDDRCEVMSISGGKRTRPGEKDTQRGGQIAAAAAARRAGAGADGERGLAAITELCGRLGVIEAVDATVGPVKQRDRGFAAGELLAGIAAAQLVKDFLTGAGPPAR